MRIGYAGRPVAAAALAVALHVPFVVRYDLHFQPDFAISLLMARAIMAGERPAFFWGQDYLGTYGCYLTALVFRVFGVSIPAAGLVSLAIFALGVAAATLLAGRLLGGRAAWWTAGAAAVSSPYANHYVTQAYSSYETAPLLTMLVVAVSAWLGRLPGARPSLPTVARWMAIGFLVGFAWWTTRLVVPALLAVCVAAGRCIRWRELSVRRTAVGLVVAGVAAAAGAAPELLYRGGGGWSRSRASAEERVLLRIAAPADIPLNLAQGLRSLPAYFNGDPVARRAEGVTFLVALWDGEEPYVGAQEDALACALDVGVRAVLLWVLVVAARSLVRAWRERDLPRLTLFLLPFVHLGLIGFSAQTGTDYYAARRYWFGSLLVFAMLFGHAVATGEAHPARWLRIGARTAAAGCLLWATVGQLRMLALPDELADYRALVAGLQARAHRAVIMPGVGWVVAGPSLGDIDIVDGPCVRRPQMCADVLRREQAALVLHGRDKFPGQFTLSGRFYMAVDESPQVVGRLRWLAYRRLDRERRSH